MREVKRFVLRRSGVDGVMPVNSSYEGIDKQYVLASDFDAQAAELAEVKGREAVAEVVHCNEATGHFNLLGMRRLQAGAKLYTTPPAATSEAQGHTSEAAPGVAGLVKALEATLKLGRGTSGRIILESEDEEALRAALSTWRQAQEGKP